MPTPPFDHPLNLLMQTVMTAVLWPLALLILMVAIRRSIREKTLFHVALVLAVAFGSLIEPLYDIAYHLLWFVPGQWTLFTSFDLPQPVWVMAAYVVVFAGPTLFLVPKLDAGIVTQGQLFRMAGMTAVTTAIFEITAINSGLYMYYGEHPFRFLEYPLWVAMLEASQITCFAVLCVWFRRKVAGRQWANLALFVLFPANFCFTTLGAGFPGLIVINMSEPPTWLLYASTMTSTAFGAVALWVVSLLLVPSREGRAAM